MKKLLLSLLLLPALTTLGQGRDTVFAVHKLFAQKRGSANGYSAASRSARSTEKYEARQSQGGPAATSQERHQDVLAGAAFGTVGVLKGSPYSPEREAEVLSLYAQGFGLPPELRRKLRRKHFHRTAQDVRAGL